MIASVIFGVAWFALTFLFIMLAVWVPDDRWGLTAFYVGAFGWVLPVATATAAKEVTS